MTEFYSPWMEAARRYEDPDFAGIYDADYEDWDDEEEDEIESLDPETLDADARLLWDIDPWCYKELILCPPQWRGEVFAKIFPRKGESFEEFMGSLRECDTEEAAD